MKTEDLNVCTMHSKNRDTAITRYLNATETTHRIKVYKVYSSIINVEMYNDINVEIARRWHTQY